jgi:hypothetical protein
VRREQLDVLVVLAAVDLVLDAVVREVHLAVEVMAGRARAQSRISSSVHAASRGKTGFRIYVVASRGRGGRSRPHPRIMEDFL